MLQRTFHTIHQRSNDRPFAIHMNGKTYLLCFEQYSRAAHVARIMESHKAITGSWPDTEISIQKPLVIEGLHEATKDDRPLKELHCVTWEKNDLNAFAINSLLHLLLIEGVGDKDLVTRAITFEYQMSQVRHLLHRDRFD